MPPVLRFLYADPVYPLQTYVMNSNGISNGIGDPFGYIKAGRSATRRYVSLFVLPYNYPKLWPLLGQCSFECFPFNVLIFFFKDELANQHKQSVPPAKWRKEFENYLAHIPPYYIPMLKNGKSTYFMNFI